MPIFARSDNFVPHLAINQSKCFTLIPKASVDINHCQIPLLYLDALSQLANRITSWSESDKKVFRDRLDYHIGAKSTYSLKETLCDKVKIIYARLSDQLDDTLGALNKDDKAAMLDKMSEDISKCTGGFYNRVSFIVSGLTVPRSIDELLMFIREELVLKTATCNNEVHNNAYYYTVANSLDLGVEPINLKDTNIRRSNYPLMVRSLAERFTEDYQPFYIANRIIDLLKSKLHAIGYVGERSDDGYVMAEFNQQIEYFNELFGASHQYEYLYLNDEGKVTDLNWAFIKTCLWEKLVSSKRFDFGASERVMHYLLSSGQVIKGNVSNQNLLKASGNFMLDGDLFEAIKYFDNLSNEQYLSLFGLWHREKFKYKQQDHATDLQKTKIKAFLSKLFRYLAEENHQALESLMSFLSFNYREVLMASLQERDENGELTIHKLVRKEKWRSVESILSYVFKSNDINKFDYLDLENDEGQTLFFQALTQGFHKSSWLISHLKQKGTEQKRQVLGLSTSKKNLLFAALSRNKRLIEEIKSKSFSSDKAMIDSVEFQKIKEANKLSNAIYSLIDELPMTEKLHCFITRDLHGESAFDKALKYQAFLAEKMMRKLKTFSKANKRKIVLSEGENSLSSFITACLYCKRVLKDYIGLIKSLELDEKEQVLMAVDPKSGQNTLTAVCTFNSEMLPEYLELLEDVSPGCLEVLFNSETTEKETALSILLKKGNAIPTKVFEKIESLQDEPLEALLEHCDKEGNSTLMVALRDNPQFFLKLNQLAMSYNSIRHFYHARSEKDESILSLALASSDPQLRAAVFAGLQHLDNETAGSLCQQLKIESDKTVLMEALRHKGEQTKEFLNFLNTKESAFKAKVIEAQNSHGWNGFFYALKGLNPYAINLLAIIEDIRQEDADEAFKLLQATSLNGTTSIMVALRSARDPALLTQLFALIKRFPINQQRALLLAVSEGGQTALSLALAHKRVQIDDIVSILQSASASELRPVLGYKGCGKTLLELAFYCQNGRHLEQIFDLCCQTLGIEETLKQLSVIVPLLSIKEKKFFLSSLFKHYCQEKAQEGLARSSHSFFGYNYGYSNKLKVSRVNQLNQLLSRGDMSLIKAELEASPETPYCPVLSQLSEVFELDTGTNRAKRQRVA